MSRKADPFSIELTPELIVRAYQAGIFPMAESADSKDVFWVSPRRRGILPLDGRFHISRSLEKRVRSNPWRISIDTDFEAVIDGCANEGKDRSSTWINPTIRRLYVELFERGICHTVEVRDGEGALVGGLYGLALGGAFFGESMFHRARDASKVALVHLVERLRAGGFVLLDTQFMTDHLRRFGGIEISQEEYGVRLAEALRHTGSFSALDRPA